MRPESISCYVHLQALICSERPKASARIEQNWAYLQFLSSRRPVISSAGTNAMIANTRLSTHTAPQKVSVIYSVIKAQFSRRFLLSKANKTVSESFFMMNINMNWKCSCKVWMEFSWIKGKRPIVASCLVTSQRSFLFKGNQLGLLTYLNGGAGGGGDDL